MKQIKLLLINLLPSMIFLVVAILFTTILSYFNILNDKILTITQILIILGAILIGSYKQGKKASKRGYLEGLEIGLIYIFIFILLNLIFYNLFNLKNLIYYLLVLITSSLGGMIGISKQTKRN